MSRCPIDERQEIPHLPLHGCLVRSRSTVCGEFQIDRRRQRLRVVGNDTQEVARLLRTWGAEREEVIGAPDQSGFLGIGPVLGESAVHEVAALRCLDVCEGDAVVGVRPWWWDTSIPYRSRS